MGEEGFCLGKEFSGTDFVEQVRKLAFGRSNAILKLVFLEADEKELPKNLDLRMVSEIKRGSNGSIEVKLQNRIELLKLLAQCVTDEAPQESGSEAESFFSAIDRAAAKLGDEEQ